MKCKYCGKDDKCEHYELEYNLRKDINYRKGEIERLEYENAKQLREIEKLNVIVDEKGKSAGKCLRRIDDHLQDKARMMQDIKDLEAFTKIVEIAKKWNSTLQSEVNSYEMMAQIYNLVKNGSGATEETTIFKDFYLFARQLILTTYLDVNRDEVDLEYMKSAFRYMLPCLGDPRALLSENEKHKIELAESILNEFGIETMDKYEELIDRGDIDIATIDHRKPRNGPGLFRWSEDCL
jgi:uncharacterized coiled-coil protein SlyX